MKEIGEKFLPNELVFCTVMCGGAFNVDANCELSFCSKYHDYRGTMEPIYITLIEQITLYK